MKTLILAVSAAIIWFVMIAVLIIGSIKESPSMNTIVTVTPSTTVVQAGQQFNVTVSIAPAVPISGAQFNLAFNPKAVQVVSIAEGGIFKQSGNTSFFVGGTIDNTNGLISNVADVIEGSGKSVSISGTVAVITCTAVTAGQTSAFTLSNVIVGSPAASPVPLDSFSIIQMAVALSWDLNLDGKVNAADMTICAGVFGQTGSPGWIPEDFLKTGVINVLDLILIGQNFT